MGPLRGDGKNTTPHGATFFDFVEKMGPLRGDGKFEICVKYRAVCVEKMGPRRGDGNSKAFCPAAFRDKVEKMDPRRGGGNKIRAASFGI